MDTTLTMDGTMDGMTHITILITRTIILGLGAVHITDVIIAHGIGIAAGVTTVDTHIIMDILTVTIKGILMAITKV